ATSRAPGAHFSPGLKFHSTKHAAPRQRERWAARMPATWAQARAARRWTAQYTQLSMESQRLFFSFCSRTRFVASARTRRYFLPPGTLKGTVTDFTWPFAMAIGLTSTDARTGPLQSTTSTCVTEAGASTQESRFWTWTVAEVRPFIWAVLIVRSA